MNFHIIKFSIRSNSHRFFFFNYNFKANYEHETTHEGNPQSLIKYSKKLKLSLYLPGFLNMHLLVQSYYQQWEKNQLNFLSIRHTQMDLDLSS